jgi:hypothetical protein
MLVIIILSLVVFGIGVQITYKILYGANKMADDLDSQTIAEIEKILRNANTPVVIPYNKITIQRGGNDIIGIGLKNIHPEARYFKMDVTCLKGFNTANEQICDETNEVSCEKICNKWWMDTKRCIPIDKKEKIVDSILINVPKRDVESGLYIFTLTVEAYKERCATKEPQDLDVPRTFYITIKS